MEKLFFFLFPVLFLSQNIHTKIDEEFEKYMKIADSMNYKSDSITYRLDIINKIDFYRDKLLISDNYKNIGKATDIFYSFNQLVGKNYDYYKIAKDKKLIYKFFELQKLLFKAKVSKEIIEYYSIRKMENTSEKIIKQQDISEANENMIINMLHSANYPIEKYNSLSGKEKHDLINEISHGYKYSE